MLCVLTVWLGVGWVAVVDEPKASVPGASTSAEALKAYEQAREKTGRSAEAQVKLALWCEAHGLTAERVKHLALAVLADPRNVTARGLMGLVDVHGKWQRPDQVKVDEKTTETLAEYNARRESLPNTAPAHWKLGLWCEENGLAAEAKAHFTTVTRLDPSRAGAWRKLGLKLHNGRWMSEAQVNEEKLEASAQAQADRRWKPLIQRYRADLLSGTPRKLEAATESLMEINDPRAVSMLWAVMIAPQEPECQAAVIPVLSQIDGPAAGRALAMIAVHGSRPDVSRAAAESLRRRDGRDFIGLLVEMVQKPIRYEVRMANGPDLPGELFVEGERVDLKREYLNKTDLNRALSEIPPRLFDASVPFDPYRTAILAQPATVLVGVPAGKAGTRAVTTTVHNPNEVAASRDLEIGRRLERIQASVSSAQQNLVRDVQQLEATNASIKQLNSQVMPVLNAVTGEDFADRADDWKSWWADQRGLVYDVPSTPRVKPVLTQVVPNSTQASISHSCFGAGTLVRTNKGLRPIESIQLGDQVLAQDTKSGRLFYTPVVAVFHNRPTSTFRVRLGNESVVATGIHRFWKAGAGWVMARDLKPGDPVRTLGGTVSVTSVETDEVQPVFNLEVADASSYFVSQTGVLVHDNSTVWPVAHPFDAAPVIASAMGR